MEGHDHKIFWHFAPDVCPPPTFKFVPAPLALSDRYALAFFFRLLCFIVIRVTRIFVFSAFLTFYSSLHMRACVICRRFRQQTPCVVSCRCCWARRSYNRSNIKIIYVPSGLHDLPSGRRRFIETRCPVDACTLTAKSKYQQTADITLLRGDAFFDANYRKPHGQVRLRTIDCMSGAGSPKHPRRRKMRHGNPRRTKIRKLVGGWGKFTFMFRGKISALNRLNSQINVLCLCLKCSKTHLIPKFFRGDTRGKKGEDRRGSK